MTVDDDGTLREEQDRARAMLYRKPVPAKMVPCEICHNCGAPVPAGYVFCDDDCLSDYRRRAERQR